jgi:hypothetical protein
LNVDLKLISHVLAQRLKKVLPKIINVDQTGYVKNRFIGFNLRQIQDIIDYADIYKIEGAIIFVNAYFCKCIFNKLNRHLGIQEMHTIFLFFTGLNNEDTNIFGMASLQSSRSTFNKHILNK